MADGNTVCAEVTEPSYTAAEPLTKEQMSATMNVALLVVVPIFLACYCGSCLAYMVYKIYRNCYRRGGKDGGVNLDSIDAPGTAPEARPAPTFPAYLPAPRQPRPPETAADGTGSSYVKTAPRYVNHQAALHVNHHADSTAERSGDVPISEILMQKMTQKISTTAR